MPWIKADPINMLSIVTAAVLALGAVQAIVRADVYWTMIAIWSFALITLPYIRYPERERSSISGLLPLVALPYIASFLSHDVSSGIMPISSPWYLLLTSMAIFALCMVTIAFINSTTGMKLNLNFAMQVAFMFYLSMVAMQGPVFYYSDLWLGTSIMLSNDSLMAYITLATIGGLFMTVLFYVTAKAMMVRRSSETTEAGE